MSVTLDEIRDRVLDTLNERVISDSQLDKAIQGADHWIIYGLFPSTPSKPEIFPPRYFSFNSHPWLDDLRVMQQMLEGLIKIPHPPKLSGNSHQRRVHRRMIERGECDSHGCVTCLKAYRQRNEYNKAKMT